MSVYMWCICEMYVLRQCWREGVLALDDAKALEQWVGDVPDWPTSVPIGIYQQH